MNYIKHLTGFFEKVATDKSLNPTHVSLYIALFQFWNCNRFKNPISISRDEVMRISKISSKATYHKCLKNLHSLGYINYEPSYNPFKGSHVYLFNFSDDLKPQPKSERKLKNEPLIEPVSEQALNKSCTSDETSSEQALVPSINYINNTNNLNIENVSNLNEQAKKIEESENDFVISTIGEITSQEKKLRQKKKGFIQPNLQEIKSYFQENSFPELEAQKFFNYFSSNGWLVGGKTPMVDWQAAAQNWMLNSINFNHNTDTNPTNRPKHLNTTTDKDYSEPL
jgi:hypothetical protein